MEKLEEGRTYQSKTHGLVKYMGIDVFYGETSLYFQCEEDDYPKQKCYWLPHVLPDHIDGVRI